MTVAVRARLTGWTVPRRGAAGMVWRGLGTTALVAGAVGLGYMLAGDGQRGGDAAPFVILAIGFLPFAAAAVFIDPRFGVAAIPLVYPFGVNQVPKTPVEVVQFLILCVVLLGALSRIARGAPPLGWSAPLGWVLALLAWTCLSLPSAADHGLAIKAVLGLFLQLLLVMAVVGICRTSRDAVLVLSVLVLVIAAVGLTTPADASSARASFNGSVITGRAIGIFVEPNQMGTFSAIGFFVGIGLALYAQTRRGRLAALAATAGCLLGLVLSLSRGAWIGFGAGMLVLIFTVPETRRALLPVGIAGILAASALGAFAPESPQVQVVGARFRSIAGEKNPYDNRPAIWAEARSVTEEHLWLGAGPGSFPVVSTTTTSNDRATSADHAHDILLTWSAEVGIPAALMILGLSIHLAMVFSRERRRARQRGRRQEAGLMAGLAAALVAVMGQGLVDYTLRNAVVLTTVFLVMGCLLAVARAESVRTEVRPVVARRVGG